MQLLSPRFGCQRAFDVGEPMKLTIQYAPQSASKSGFRQIAGKRLSLASALRARLITRKEAEEQLALIKLF